jgi:hypothetical protein
VVGADERTPPVCAVFEALVFAVDAAHACESVEISRAVAAYFLPHLKAGRAISAGGGSKKNGGGEPRGAEQI